MFEREYRDLAFVDRWQIVRVLRRQSVMEHTACVSFYVNDLCSYLGIGPMLHLACLQKALWHDVDEIFTGDTPGPAKRAMVQDKNKAKEVTGAWMDDVFGGVRQHRDGSGLNEFEGQVAHLILKTADELDAACQMASEVQMGNMNCRVRITGPRDRCLNNADLLCDMLQKPVRMKAELKTMLNAAIVGSLDSMSKGPDVISGYSEWKKGS